MPAPTSSRTSGPFTPGRMAASAGRRTPCMRPRPTTAAATVAPLAPAETTAAARRTPSASIAAADRGLRIRAVGDRVGHADAAIHGVHRDAGPVDVGERGNDLVGDPAGADEQQLEIGFGSTRLQSAVNHDGGGVVPAEEVDGDPQGAGCLVQPTRCGWRHPGPKGSDLEDLATVVRAADGAHGVRQLRRPALRAGDGRDRRSPSTAPGATGCCCATFALRYGHGFSLDQAGGSPAACQWYGVDALCVGGHSVRRCRAAQRESTCWWPWSAGSSSQAPRIRGTARDSRRGRAGGSAVRAPPRPAVPAPGR